jgi:hypothetical protein
MDIRALGAVALTLAALAAPASVRPVLFVGPSPAAATLAVPAGGLSDIAVLRTQAGRGIAAGGAESGGHLGLSAGEPRAYSGGAGEPTHHSVTTPAPMETDMPFNLNDFVTVVALLLAAATAFVSAPRSAHEGYEKAEALLTTMAAPEWDLVVCAVGCTFPAPP